MFISSLIYVHAGKFLTLTFEIPCRNFRLFALFWLIFSFQSSETRNKLLIHARIWMNLKEIMVSKGNQTQNATYCMVFFQNLLMYMLEKLHKDFSGFIFLYLLINFCILFPFFKILAYIFNWKSSNGNHP